MSVDLTFRCFSPGILALLLLGFVMPAYAVSGAQEAGETLYQDAMQLISDGRFEEAREALQRLVSVAPEHAGALLDIAILHCTMGGAAEAEALFLTIESRFSPPQAIREVIAQQRAGGCRGREPAKLVRLRVGYGVDDNANQGASNPNFSIGRGINQVNLVLSPEYAPKQDQFTLASGELTQALSVRDTVVFAQFQARQYAQYSQFDVGSAVFGLEHAWRQKGWSLRGLGMVGLVTVGGALYQTQRQVQLQLVPPLQLQKGGELSVLGGWTGVAYPTLAGFGSQLWELRGQWGYQSANMQLQASAGYALDKGSDQRPGGDRSGAVASLSSRMRLVGDVFGELSWRQQGWGGRRPYSPGLIDQHRQQETQQFRAAVTFPIAQRQALHLEWRAVHNRENISLFEYRGHVLQLSWEWQPGA